MVRRIKTKTAPCRKCPKCGYPMNDLDYICKKCGQTVEPETPAPLEGYGTPE